MKFTSTDTYIAADDLAVAVNAAVTLERPLLVKGEPGTGKTELALQVASALGMDMIEWNIKSTTRAQQGLYEYDAVSRLRDSQLGDERVRNVSNYIKKGKIWQAFRERLKKSSCSSMRLTRLISNFPTTCCKNSTEWRFMSMKPAKPSKRAIAQW